MMFSSKSIKIFLLHRFFGTCQQCIALSRMIVLLFTAVDLMNSNEYSKVQIKTWGYFFSLLSDYLNKETTSMNSEDFTTVILK